MTGIKILMNCLKNNLNMQQMMFSYLHKIKTELEKMLIRENRMDLYKRCLDFLDTRVELDQSGFKFDIFEH